jgi:hypothetical protein
MLNREGEIEDSSAMKRREGNTVDTMMGMAWLLVPERRNYFSFYYWKTGPLASMPIYHLQIMRTKF